ncbi:MAG: Rod shape-determining protein mreB [Parcubacteria group bacterium GW2011_GWF2_39_13b]|nr:MAG: Rod shape-determining protein mreB [Parcubacteria group bacterium GW2011_GWF2_39_13b]
MFIKKIGIDLGTANTLVFVPKKGVIINEPTVVAVSLEDNRILAVGNEAKKMLGRTPETIVASRPMRDGVIADYRITEAMLRYFIKKASGKLKILRPEVMVAVPAGITSTERRAVIDATMRAGARAAYVVKEPILAAIGAGIPINEPAGHMIIDVGGGTSEVAVISLGGVVSCSSAKVGGNKIDQAIADFIKKKYNLEIGERTAEEIKIKIGSAMPLDTEESMEIRGRDLITGLPQTIEIRSNEICLAIGEQLRQIIQTIKNVLQETPPELSADVMDKGMVLSGGSGQLRNLDKLISEATGVPCRMANDPLFCVVRGTGIALEHLDVYKRSLR